MSNQSFRFEYKNHVDTGALLLDTIKDTLKKDKKAQTLAGIGGLVSVILLIVVLILSVAVDIYILTFLLLLVWVGATYVCFLPMFKYIDVKTGIRSKTDKIITNEQNEFSNELDKHIQNNNFVISKKVFGPYGTDILALDTVHKKWLIGTLTNSSCDYNIYDYNQLANYEVVKDGKQIVSSNAGKAIAGGLLFGMAGAIVGASGEKEIQSNITDMYISITDSNATIHKIAICGKSLEGRIRVPNIMLEATQNGVEEFVSILDVIKFSGTSTQIVSNVGNADELSKFKKLLDDGIITQEEFNAKKKQLLGL